MAEPPVHGRPPSDGALPTLWPRFVEIATGGLSAVGGQLWVAAHGEVVTDVAVGDSAHGAMRTDTAHSGYCLGKPILALAALALVADGLVRIDAPLPECGAGRLTLRHVLDHHAGLDAPSAVDHRMAPPEDRDALLRDGVARAEERPAYSEIAWGVVVERMIERITGEDASAFVRRRVLAPVGLGDDVAVCGPDARRLVGEGRASAAVGGLPVRRTPMTSTLLDAHLDAIRPAFDVLWSARAAGRLMDAVGRTLAGADSDELVHGSVLRDACTPRWPAFDDRWTKRRMRFAGGFWVDLAATDVARRASPRAVGAIAGITNAFAITDPDAGATIAVYLNGASLDVELAALDRRSLCDALLEDLS